jgi:hypothetical protein
MAEERSFSVVAVTFFGKKEVACCPYLQTLHRAANYR